MKNSFKIGKIEIGLDAPLFVMAGPCVIEDKKMCIDIGKRLVDIAAETGIGIIFKASFDKANRSSASSFRGPGLTKGLAILDAVRQKTGLSIMTDIHEAGQAADAGKVVDCLQIPAFLCRQTDLLVACAKTGKPMNVKKGQFLSPAEMKNVVDKVRSCKNDKIMLTERGTFFGYNRLVTDMTAIDAMKKLGCPVIFDATHSTQMPGGLGTATAGRPEMAPLLARAAIAAGANGLFIEVHPQPAKSKSDAGCIMDISLLQNVLLDCKKVFDVVRSLK
jgi:2-dehydro-3-deoxyphosphooctonate aldolase (KDO 8-P synthase)